ncbi:LemA family protein [Methylobacillus arboreus]|uniref:LemA family protein n=1 Tax=Methylobacillus arboreus TaxID=755170 RepID=UPI001E63A6DB|nr:LemA family protein [Methylobacillus arboreus]MCB5190091.1 LemA family protein [Methylobacillus arboreus]
MQIFLVVLLVVAVVYFIMVYNGLVNLKNNVEKAWANIDVLLKQRHDELPKLVDTCKQYMQHEQATLQQVIQARSRVQAASEQHDVVALGAAESALRTGLGALFAVAESYPELKANEQFLHLQARISGLENAIADRREFYNESVNLHNVRIAQFPDLLVARALGFNREAMLRFARSELKDVDIAARFRQ